MRYRVIVATLSVCPSVRPSVCLSFFSFSFLYSMQDAFGCTNMPELISRILYTEEREGKKGHTTTTQSKIK